MFEPLIHVQLHTLLPIYVHSAESLKNTNITLNGFKWPWHCLRDSFYKPSTSIEANFHLDYGIDIIHNTSLSQKEVKI